MTERLLAAIAGDAVERLRWRVLDYFKLPPTAELSAAELLWCAANMVLDMEKAEASCNRALSAQYESGASFDEGRFAKMRGAAHGG